MQEKTPHFQKEEDAINDSSNNLIPRSGQSSHELIVAMPKKEPKQISSAKNMIGMSPIISFRPLNKVGLQGHTSLGTNLGAIHDSGHD